VRILLDLQGAQGEGRVRGIGRLTMSLARAIIRNAGEHEVWIGLTDAMPATVAPLRDAFRDLLPDERIAIWKTLSPTADRMPELDGRLEQAQVVREAFINMLAPDIVHCSSVIEGADESSVSTINRHFPGPRTAATLYDLIPLINAGVYLSHFSYRRWYRRRLAELRRADVLLAISESSLREGREMLGLPDDRLVNIRAAVDDIFVPRTVPPEREAALRERYGMSSSFIMYTGGIDPRKNVYRLVSAYALLPADLRGAHQLVFVGKGDPVILPDLRAHIATEGIAEEQVVFTGFVSDDDMVDLYNLSTAFVFPSTHEGFGLPPLEAMSCGIPTIAANASSLPEVVGNPDALFDPYDTHDMAAKLERVLTDEDFRQELARSGRAQARTFSWDDSAQRTLAAFEAAVAKPRPAPSVPSAPFRPRLALVTVLPRTGTPEHQRLVRLIDELDAWYEVDIVTEGDVERWDIDAPSGVLSAEEFDKVSGRYDRIVHHYANDPAYGFVRRVQARHPGTVLLDDYYLDLALSGASYGTDAGQAWIHEVVVNHGCDTLHHVVVERREGRPSGRLPLNTQILALADGVVVTGQHVLDAARQDLGAEAVADWITVPMLMPGALVEAPPQAGRRVVAAFGSGSTQWHHRLVTAWLACRTAQDPTAELVIVGERPDTPYAQLLEHLIADGHPAAGWRLLSENDADETLDQVRFAVQLSPTPDVASRRWAASCGARGIPVVTSDDVGTGLSSSLLAAALDEAWDRWSTGERTADSTVVASEAYHEAIEQLHAQGRLARQRDVLRVAAQQPSLDAAEWDRTVSAVLRNDPPPGERQLLLDITTTMMSDSRTGIQRVSRSLARCLLENPPEGFRVELVYSGIDYELRYARRYACAILGHPAPGLHEDPVVVRPGDVYVGLDLNVLMFPNPAGEPPLMEPVLEWLRSRGVSTQFVVYDLLPCHNPTWFVWPEGWFDSYVRRLVQRENGLIAISRSTADDIDSWIRAHEPDGSRLPVDWFHLGADIENSVPSDHETPGFDDLWSNRATGPSILMVGTVEPRKGHDQAFAAFDQLWREGVEINLVIVGKAGWGREDLAHSMRAHPQWGKRLLWFEEASDSEVIRLNRESDGCLMASRGEGFGLPLIEAARYDIPILARDLSVFEEVAGDNATYFSGDDPAVLASSITTWLRAIDNGTAPRSGGIRWLTWEESTTQFVAALKRNLER
jgi:glycosyltransferase involved in cell wall biosynthesis